MSLLLGHRRYTLWRDLDTRVIGELCPDDDTRETVRRDFTNSRSHWIGWQQCPLGSTRHVFLECIITVRGRHGGVSEDVQQASLIMSKVFNVPVNPQNDLGCVHRPVMRSSAPTASLPGQLNNRRAFEQRDFPFEPCCQVSNVLRGLNQHCAGRVDPTVVIGGPGDFAHLRGIKHLELLADALKGLSVIDVQLQSPLSGGRVDLP
ncbi:hypothetical protein D3C84_735380 [compost metagenome]